MSNNSGPGCIVGFVVFIVLGAIASDFREWAIKFFELKEFDLGHYIVSGIAYTLCTLGAAFAIACINKID